MSDFRLKVFYTVAKNLSFTKASKELYISQPAVTNHIRELENEYDIALFDRKGSKIYLTKAGMIMLKHAENIFRQYRSMEFDINGLQGRHKGELKIGASTTMAQYIVPSILAQFHERYENVRVTLVNGNTQQIEKALLKKNIHLGIVEGRSKQPDINYQDFMTDEILLVGSMEEWGHRKKDMGLEELKNVPLLLREQGSGTLEVIYHRLEQEGISPEDLDIKLSLGSTESIKSYLKKSSCLAFLPIHAILEELSHQKLFVLDIDGLDIQRIFHFIQLQGAHDDLATTFIRFAKHFKEE